MDTGIVTAFSGRVLSSPDGLEAQSNSDSTTMNVPTFEELYETYHDYVKMRVCFLLRYRPDLIDDAIQETWIKAWRFLPTIESTRNLKAWLWLVCTNTVRDMMRHCKSYEPHYPSLEATLDHFGIHDECRGANYLDSDPHEYIPALLERKVRRQHVWSGLSAHDRETFSAYVANKPVRKQALYAARRNFRARYKRDEKREQKEAS
jgi:DNA-directed RNA polymerase specialized sigma24 family protein